jgi:hypothetical protein
LCLRGRGRKWGEGGWLLFFFGVFEVDDGEMLIFLEGDLISDR